MLAAVALMLAERPPSMRPSSRTRQMTLPRKSVKILRYPWGTSWPPPNGSGNYADDAAKKDGIKTETIEGYNDGYAETGGEGVPSR